MAHPEELQGTSLDKGRGFMEDSDVEALIKETLAESKSIKPAAEDKEPKEVKPFKATPLTTAPKKEEVAPPPPPQTPLPVQTEPQTAKDAYATTFKEYTKGDIVTGTVVKVDPTAVLVDIGYKAEGFIEPKDLTPEEQKGGIKVGDKINVLIEQLENREGYVVLSKRKADYELGWKQAYQAFKERSVLEAKVTSAVKGGLVVDYNGIRGFIPASQVKQEAGGELQTFVGQTIPIKVIRLDRRAGKIVLSHKMAAGEKKQYEKEKIFNEIEVGQVRHGRVSSLKNFGAFVDIGGVEGLIHVTEMSWKRVKHPSEMLKAGQEIDVFVLGVDKVNKKVALGLKELQTDPWAEAINHFKVGQTVKGKVARLVDFGAFLELEYDLEGLCHISEISTQKIKHPSEAVKIGDEVEVKILRILPDEQKIGLSIRRVLQDKEKARLREEQEKLQAQKEAEARVTIGDMLKQKETEKAAREEKAATPEPESMAEQTTLEIGENTTTPPVN